jgi:hypothetical protein
LNEIERYRFSSLFKHVESALGNIESLSGVSMLFEYESRILYDAVAPKVNADFLKKEIQKLEALLPGNGNIATRLRSMKEKYTIPLDKMDTIMQIIVAECRRSTVSYIELPEKESITIELVKDQPFCIPIIRRALFFHTVLKINFESHHPWYHFLHPFYALFFSQSFLS